MAAITERSTPLPPQRATQGFVGTLTWTWKRPALTLIEIAWRWIFGAPALWICYQQGARLLAGVPWQTTGVAAISVNQLLTDPMTASVTLAAFAGMILPGLLRTAAWAAPLLLVYWVLVSTAGRTLLLRRMDPALRTRPGTLLTLQFVRLLPLLAIAALWWFGLQLLARTAVLAPIESGGEPHIMTYVGGAIVLSLGLFLLAAASGWIFSIAPILSMRDGTGVLQSLRDALHLRHLRGSLMEINLVLSVVKIMLLVLAMAFSAFPLPFASVMTDGLILLWSALVGLWYFASSDFFHVTRLTGYLHLLERRELTQGVTAASE